MNNRQDESAAYANHAEIWLLLPWYANGSLGAAERERVKAHLRVCLICRKEVAEQAGLARHLQHETRVEFSAQPSFERLMARIQNEQATPVVQAPPGRKAYALAAWTAWVGQWLSNMDTPRLAAACASLLLVLALPFWFAEEQPVPAPRFHTVADNGSMDRFEPGDLRVVFASQVSLEDRDRLLAEVRGRIVEGPSPAGVYTLHINNGGDGPLDLNRALARLRANPAVVFAEPALPPPSPANQESGG